MNSSSYDTRKYECCAPYYGEVGQEFTRRFKPEFEGSLHNYVDDYASLYEHVVLQSDPGAAGVAHMGNAAAVLLSERAYDKRLKKSFGLIRRHVEDPTLRDDIDANAMGNGPAAWAIVSAAGTAQQTYLNLNEQDMEWEGCTLADVGVDERTLANFKALLDRLNRERPVAQQKTNVQVWQKLLQAVRLAAHAELKLKATDQLQTPTIVHPVGHALAGQPDVNGTVRIFSERWRAAIADGSLRRQPPRKQVAPKGNRVDALLAGVSEQLGAEEYSALLSQANSKGLAPASERVCWNCKGIGHMNKDQSGTIICPSPQANRTFTACINALEVARKREGAKKSFRFVRRKSPRAASDARLVESQEAITLEVDEDGRVFTHDGTCVFDSMPEGATVIDEADSTQMVDEPPCVDARSAATTLGGNATLSNDLTMEEYDIDADFEAAFRCPAHLADCPAPRVGHQRSAFGTALGLVFLAGAALAVSLRRSGAAGRLLTVACAASSLVIRPAQTSMVPLPSAILDLKLGANKVQSSRTFNAHTGGVLDTGATKHASGRVRLFPRKHITTWHPNLVIETADNTQCKVMFIGSMLLPVNFRDDITKSTKKRAKLLVSDALYVPALRDITLLSPKALFANEGIRTYFNDDLFMRLPSGRVLDFVETDRLFILPFPSDTAEVNPILSITPKPSAPLSLDHLHAKFNHFSVDGIIRSAHCLTGIDFSKLPISAPSRHECETCVRASMRHHRTPVRTEVRYTRFGACMCSDTCDMGVYSVPFGFRYFLSFLDMATKYLFVYFLRTHEHAEVRRAFLQFVADAKPYLPKGHVELWFMDNGSEFSVAAGVGKDRPGFFANDTDSWLAEYYTRRKFIVPWNPQQNPAESVNRVLLRPARAALLHGNARPRLWPFAIHQSVIIHNALVTTSKTAVHIMLAEADWGAVAGLERSQAMPLSPFVMVHKKPFNARFLEPIFCLCFCKITNAADLAELAKPEPRTTAAIHLGLDHRRHGYFVYLIRYKRYTTSAYHDTFFPKEVTYPDVVVAAHEIAQDGVRHRLPTEEAIVESNPVEPHTVPAPAQDDNDRPARAPSHLPSGNTRSAGRQVVAGLSASVEDGFFPVADFSEPGRPCLLLLKSDAWRPLTTPSTVAEALEQDKAGWLAAYKRDFEAKMANGAFSYLRRPTDGSMVHPIGWAHKIVWNDDNTVSELRARLVGKGYRQVRGVDFAENYSSTPRIASIRLFLAMVAALDLDTEHCDVIKAFTQNAVTDVPNLLVEQPPALPKVVDEEGRPMVLRCIMALEGFRQSGHLHQINHSATFTSQNDVAVFSQIEFEPTIFCYAKGRDLILAVVWTDDVLFAFSDSARPTYERFLSEVYGRRWNFKRKGPVARFAGIDIRRDRSKRSVSIDMAKYVEGVFRRFVPSGHPTRSLPARNKDTFDQLRIARDAIERDAVKDKPYLAACACLLWLQSTLRADIAIHVALLCQLMHDPSPAAWDAAVDLIAYAHYSKSAAITYSGDPQLWKCPLEFTGDKEAFQQSLGLHAYCDSSWKTRSLGGYIIFLAGGPVDWSTKLIRTVCHSSAEAEVAAGCALAKSLVHTRHLACALQLKIDSPTPVFIDSAAAILIASNVGVTKRTLHFERWQHYLRECVQRKLLHLIHVTTKRQRADALTKVVDATSQRWLYSMLFQSES